MKRLVLLVVVVVLQSTACAQNRQAQRLPLIKVESILPPISRSISRSHSYLGQNGDAQLISRIETLEKKFRDSNAMILVLDGRIEFLNLRVKNLQHEVGVLQKKQSKTETLPEHQQHRKRMPVAQGPLMYATYHPTFALGEIEVSGTKKDESVSYYAKLFIFGALALIAWAWVLMSPTEQRPDDKE